MLRLRRLRRLVRTRLAPVGLVVFIIMVFVSIAAPVLSPTDPLDQDYDHVLEAPSRQFLLGTDYLGRDILSRIVYGTRVSIQVGIISVGIAALVGCVLGLVAGFFGGWVDDLIMRIADAILSFPSLILALAITSVLGPGLTNTMIAIGIVGIPGYARLVRGQVLSVKEWEFVVAAQAMGAGRIRIMFRHVLVNVLAPIIVQASLSIATAIRTEASLSFLGLGVRPPTPSWGSMLKAAYPLLYIAPWYSIFPGLAIFIAILSLNWLGDGIRMLLDPRLMERRKG